MFLPPLIGLVVALTAGLTPQVAREDAAIVIRDVTVLPATGAPPTTHATVIVRGERIAAVGPASTTPVPQGASVIDGSGRFLVPGFIDLHVHLSKARASSLGLFVANGVTTVRDMGGDTEELQQWRREIVSGSRLGPRVLMAGPILEAPANIERMRKDPPEERVEPFERVRIAVGSPEEARRVMASLAKRGVDFVKIRTIHNRETYVAIVAAAHEHKLKVAGHVAGIPPQVVLEAGQDCIDHQFYPSLEGMTREQRVAVWRKFAERGVPIVPTLVTLFEGTFPTTERLRAVVDDANGRVDPRRKYLSRYLLLDWREQVLEHVDERVAAWRKVWDDVIHRDLLEMHDAGMDLLVGSDVAALNVFPGFSVHDEMARFVSELGMTPAQVLERATSRSARFLGLGDSVGTIETGKVADLVLLDANPLDDIRNTRRISTVVVRGALRDRRRLDAVLAAVESHPDRKNDDWGRTRSR